ncbi:MAG TPA: MerR family transcriptional regulator, partial [Chitinophagaceae bacterium]|nr:MerR family transcriptional regulator [Chitinophagaceae bacterium]
QSAIIEHQPPSFVSLPLMSKQLAQITFDFSAQEEAVAKPATITPVAEEVIVAPVPVDEAPIVEEPAEEKKASVKKITSGGKRGRKSLKDIATAADLIDIPEDEVLFKKQYYPIGEVATMFRENQSLIRYWETEFDILQPRKNRKGDRFFRPVDIKNLVLIYDLLRRRKFTIEGAKDYLKKNKKAEEKFAMIQSLQKIKGFLLELKANL